MNDIIKNEEKVLKFWERNQIFKKSLEKNKKGRRFVFYEGPPSANASPHVGHVLARVFKDVIPRYKTMRGFYVERKAGWDTHGLPIELEVEKELGIKTKRGIEKYGVEEFNQKCRDSVWRYKEEWEKLTKRIGYWIDLNDPYITYDNKYMESLWWIIKEIHRKNLLYKDYKVVPYCPRCGTALSSHEVAQGYKNINEPAIYVKFQITNSKLQIESKIQNPKPKTYLLIWTTTPWTLPGNVAVAVNPALTYVKVSSQPPVISSQTKREYFILAKERLDILDGKYKVLEEFKGKDLIGLKYEPLFKIKDAGTKAYKVLSGDFIKADEGTGLVHIAPAFGVDDMEAIKNQKLSEIPILLTMDENGKMRTPGYKWDKIFVKDADPLIIKDLEGRGLLYKTEMYEHDYPYCWRCDSPLLYCAKESWFVGISKLKNDLLKNNQAINWMPEHLKKGRFGEWLLDIKDWAFSRDRYWGTPLPLWHCKKCKKTEVVGSLDDLDSLGKFNNNYLIMRHGKANSNYENYLSSWPEKKSKISHLTIEGTKQVRKTAQKLKKEKIDLIFASDLARIKETVDIAQKELKFPKPKIKFDPRIREYQLGILNGKPVAEHRALYSSRMEEFTKRVPKGENLTDIKKRMVDFIFWLEKKYKNKNILIVSHGDPMWMLKGALLGLGNEELLEKEGDLYLDYAQYEKLKVRNIPLNNNYELDLHKPYIDNLKLYCKKCDQAMERTPEVADVWFDSGAMPFAQAHWPFAFYPERSRGVIQNQKLLYPADYICEAIDQTRGWFYTLLAVATLLGKGPPYKNVISTGHVLDSFGQKMSKSKGNVIDPWDVVNQYGSDALRWHFLTVNAPGDPKNFDARDVAERYRKFISTLWNAYIFFDTYRSYKDPKFLPSSKTSAAGKLLDRWILSCLNELIADTARKLDKYDIVAAARGIEEFVDDLSNWYVRRSRRRFQKPESLRDYESALKTLGGVLLVLTKLIAPFAPFIAESIYKNLNGAKAPQKTTKAPPRESVHLCDYPKSDKELIDKELNKEMNYVRQVAALGLKARAGAGIKVRQPLRELRIKNQESRIKGHKLGEEFLDLIKEELNIKRISTAKEQSKAHNLTEETDGKITVLLDIHITPDLRQEGWARDIIRNIQEMRRSVGFKPQNKISIQWSSSESFIKKMMEKWSGYIKNETLAVEIKEGAREKKIFNAERDIKLDNREIWIAIKKIS